MFCFLCQSGNIPKNLQNKGIVWVHQKCIMELFDFHNDFKAIKEILAGNRNESIEKFLTRMYRFDEQWNRTIKLFELTPEEIKKRLENDKNK